MSSSAPSSAAPTRRGQDDQPGSPASTGGDLRLLLVEDSRVDAMLIQTYLREVQIAGTLTIDHVVRLSEAADKLAGARYDCVLLDLGLPDGTGLENIAAIQAADDSVAIVVLTGLKDDEMATNALQRGAQDYIIKGDAEDGTALLRTIRYAVERRSTELQQSSRRRQASEALVRGIVATVPDALVTLVDGGVIEDANPAAEAMFGYATSELVGRTVYDLNPPDRRAKSELFINALLNNEDEDAISAAEGVGLRADGSTFPTEFSIGRALVDGRPILVCAVRDVTERKQADDTIAAAQEQLLAAEKFASLGGLVAGVAHEINTPVGIGVTAASHLQERTEDLMAKAAGGTLRKSDLDTYLAVARESSKILLSNLERAAGLIQGFKQVAVDQSSDDLRDFVVADYLGDVLRSLAPALRRSRLDVSYTVDPPDLCIHSHPGNWSQIVTNLIQNSQVHAFEPDEPGQITIAITAKAQRLQMIYRDNGRGIPPEHLNKVFDPFYTTKRGQGGSGLGLNVVYNLATQGLGGRLQCESTLGKGVAFEFDLPLKHCGAE